MPDPQYKCLVLAYLITVLYSWHLPDWRHRGRRRGPGWLTQLFVFWWRACWWEEYGPGRRGPSSPRGQGKQWAPPASCKHSCRWSWDQSPRAAALPPRPSCTSTYGAIFKKVDLAMAATRVRICKRLRSPGIDSASHVAWQAGTSNRVLYLPSKLWIDSWAQG